MWFYLVLPKVIFVVVLALREEGRKQTYGSDRVVFLCYPPRVQQWAPLKKIMKDKHEGLENSQRKGKRRIFREMATQLKMRLHY